MAKDNELAKLLRMMSPSSKVWFDSSTNSTQSLAVMSMVRYILGHGSQRLSKVGKALKPNFAGWTPQKEKFFLCYTIMLKNYVLCNVL